MIGRLRAAFVEVIASFGADAFGSTPEQLGAFIQKGFAKWTKVVKDANVRVD